MKIKVHETLTKTSLTIIAIYLLSLSTLTITYIRTGLPDPPRFVKLPSQSSDVISKQVMSCASSSVKILLNKLCLVQVQV